MDTLQQSHVDLFKRHFSIWDSSAHGKSGNAHLKLKMTEETFHIFARRLSKSGVWVSVYQERWTLDHRPEGAHQGDVRLAEQRWSISRGAVSRGAVGSSAGSTTCAIHLPRDLLSAAAGFQSCPKSWAMLICQCLRDTFTPHKRTWTERWNSFRLADWIVLPWNLCWCGPSSTSGPLAHCEVDEFDRFRTKSRWQRS